ncbi:fasciclin-2-like isoform X2 [Pectinophora gossypiella]|uniref:fasciclin-2-like isoform X2 n=1 Tax=Pectinophora gossypiella TaxID=13191 RepID=UPI00214E8F3F|nr:fasciclin-2-like isoform X2 [Pectinophora gossypiella]
MIKMKTLSISFLLAIISALFVKECFTCFTYNEFVGSKMWKSGDSFYSECVCEHPVLAKKNLKWLGPNDQEIVESGPGKAKVYTEWKGNTLNLHIASLSKPLSGIYKCVSEGMNRQRYTISQKIEVYDPLYFVNANATQYLIKGQDSLITCEARADSNPEITWSKGQDDEEITVNNKYDIIQVGLVIKNVTEDDAGTYRCKAQVLDTGENVDRYIKAEVMKVPVVKEISANPNNVLVEGKPLTLDCLADGLPLPSYIWRKFPNHAGSIKNVTWHQDFSKIVFKNITEEDRGVYQCTAHNKAGVTAKNITVEVHTKPRISKFKNITVAEGSPATIKCAATGRPRPDVIILYYGDEPAQPVFRNKSSENSMDIVLTFDKIEKFHERIYYCNASNEVGFTVEKMYLKVLHKPHFKNPEEMVWAWDEKTVNLSCEHESQPPAIVMWSFKGNSDLAPEEKIMEVNQLWSAKISKTTEHYIKLKPVKNFLYGTYECIAKNHLGSAKKVIHVKKGFIPPPMGHVQISDITASSVTFELTAPENTGPPVIGFKAEYDTELNYNITNIHLNRTWAIGIPYKIDKLEKMTRYFIRFAAINEVGTGPLGPFLQFDTPGKSVPEPPTWENEADLTEEGTESNCTVKVIPPTTNVALDDLSENTTYLLEMVAHNSVGNSTPTRLEFTVEMMEDLAQRMTMSAGEIVGIAIAVVILCIVLLDILLLVTRKKGMIATCCFKKNKKKKEANKQSRDKKGLLKDNSETTDTLKRPDNGHKEYEYNKSTGVITGKHSAV